jgi:hypothetical protein
MVRVNGNRGTERHVADEVEEAGEESTTIISVLAQSNRRDRWTVAPHTSMFTLLARSFFDFRQAETTGKAVEIAVTCVFGKVTLVVPEGTDVQLSGISFLASATSDVASSDEPSSRPKLIVTAHTVFGKLCVRTPNEAERALLAGPKDAEAAASLGEESARPTAPAASDAHDDFAVPRQPVGSSA